MISRNVPDLHPNSAKWYRLVWSQSELGTGVTIASASWSADTGIAIDTSSLSGLTASVKLSVNGATAGNTYTVTCQIVTSGGETLHETLRIRVSTDGH